MSESSNSQTSELQRWVLLEIAQEHLRCCKTLLKSLVAHMWTFQRPLALQLVTSWSQPAFWSLGDVRNSSVTPSHSQHPVFAFWEYFGSVCVCGSQGQTQASVLGRPSQLLLSHMAQGKTTLQGTGGLQGVFEPLLPSAC